MANTVKLKRSATPSAVPTTGQLDLGEIAINTYDGKMFIKKDDGAESVVEIGGGAGASALDDLTDVTISSPASGEVLSYNGSGWVNAAPAAGGSVYYKDPVRVATVANGTLATAFANGQMVDGVTLVTGDRILLKNQSTVSQNGIYVVNASGAPTRASDMDANSEAQRGLTVYVQYGNVNGGSNFQLTSASTDPVVIGSTNLYWMPLQGIAGYGVNSWTTPSATGSNAISAGNNARATNTGTSAFGNASNASGLRGTAIGNSTTASGTNAVAIGSGAQATQTDSFAIGRDAFATGAYSRTIGYNGGATHDHSVVIQTGGGGSGGSNFIGDNCFYSNNYRHSLSNFVMAKQTTNATGTRLGIGGDNVVSPSNDCVFPNSSSWVVDGYIIARNTATAAETAVWKIEFVIYKHLTTTIILGTPTITVVAQPTGTTTWAVSSITAGSGYWSINISGEDAKTIKWTAGLRGVKVQN